MRSMSGARSRYHWSRVVCRASSRRSGGGDPSRAGCESRPQHRESVLTDAAGPREVAVEVAEALPRADRSKVLGRTGGYRVLREREVRDPVESDLAGGPGLRSCPRDEVFVVVCLLRLEQMRLSLGGAAAPSIRVHDGVAARHPEGGVRRLPPGPRRDPDPVGLRHDPVLRIQRAAAARAPRHGILPVRMRRQDDRHRLIAAGPEHVDAQHGSIAHRDRDVALENPVGFGRGDIHTRLREQTDAACDATEKPRGRVAKSLRGWHRHGPDATAAAVAPGADPRGRLQVGIRVSHRRLADPSSIAYA